MLVKTTDGTPDAVKVARPVWSGGKSGDNFKGLPITIEKKKNVINWLENLRSLYMIDWKSFQSITVKQRVMNLIGICEICLRI